MGGGDTVNMIYYSTPATAEDVFILYAKLCGIAEQDDDVELDLETSPNILPIAKSMFSTVPWLTVNYLEIFDVALLTSATKHKSYINPSITSPKHKIPKEIILYTPVPVSIQADFDTPVICFVISTLCATLHWVAVLIDVLKRTNDDLHFIILGNRGMPTGALPTYVQVIESTKPYDYIQEWAYIKQSDIVIGRRGEEALAAASQGICTVILSKDVQQFVPMEWEDNVISIDTLYGEIDPIVEEIRNGRW